MEAITSKTQMAVTDCSSAEILAQQIQKGSRLRGQRDEDAPFFPNRRVVGRDTAHASQKLLSRPWAADSALNTLMIEAISGKDSIAQKLWNTNVYSSMLVEEIKRSDNTRGTTLDAAKHRFANFSKPLGRIVRHLPSMLTVLQRIIASRTAQDCRSTLHFPPEDIPLNL
eukprot:1370499-Amphidinium_carterae.1